MQDVFAAKWKQLRNELTYHWSQLSSDDLDGTQGNRENLVFLLEHRYGYVRGRAEREVERVIAEFVDRLQRSS